MSVPEWETGIGGAQCSGCGRTTVCVSQLLMFDQYSELICRPCWLGLDDVLDYEDDEAQQ